MRQVHREDKKLHFNGGRVVLWAEILQNEFIGNMRLRYSLFAYMGKRFWIDFRFAERVWESI